MAFIIDFLAGVFDGQKNFDNALKVSVYRADGRLGCAASSASSRLWRFSASSGSTASICCGPASSALMKAPAGKALIYAIAVVVCIIVLWIVVFSIVGAIFGVGMMRYRLYWRMIFETATVIATATP